MKKIFIIIAVFSLYSLTAFGANYKINGNGKVITPSNTPASNPMTSQSTNYYNNYMSNDYVKNKQVTVVPIGTIDIVIDFSGSMTNWINVAKQCMTAIVAQLPSSTKIGLRVFGEYTNDSGDGSVIGEVKKIVHNKKQKYKISTKVPSYLGNNGMYCNSTRQVAKVDYKNTSALMNGMNSAIGGGNTPLTKALYQAVNIDFIGLSTTDKKKIILITDGGESCGGDPCAFAADLMRKRSDIIIDVVLVSNGSKELKCLTNATGGTFYNVADDTSFVNVLHQSITQPVVQDNSQIQTQTPTQNYEYVEY